MPKGYHHLTQEERCQICALRKTGLSEPAIARQLGYALATEMAGVALRTGSGEDKQRVTMTDTFEAYTLGAAPLPKSTLAWNLYGAGIDNFGRGAKPEECEIPAPAQNQLLVRVDAVSLCYSDVKVLRQGNTHTKLRGRDLRAKPTRLGHEVALTVLAVGDDMQKQYHLGQRLAVQPDIYHGGGSAAYGYQIPGGLTQFQLLGPEVLAGDDGAYVIPLGDDTGYAEAALSEPWACVEAAYTPRRRLEPAQGGTMWLIGEGGDSGSYRFTRYLEKAGTIVLTDVGEPLAGQICAAAKARGQTVSMRYGLNPDRFAAMADDATEGHGFDDVVVVAPRSAHLISQAARTLASRGVLNLVGNQPLDRPVAVDIGRLHYDFVAIVGNSGTDAADSYGEGRNRCDLRPGGTTLVVGAGGPMGQMHVQRAIEMDNGPELILATDIDPHRLNILARKLGPLAAKNGRQLVVLNAHETPDALWETLDKKTDGRGFDDIVLCVPSGDLAAQASRHLKSNGMLVLFAGIPTGTFTSLDLNGVYLGNMQYTGTSGSTIVDQKRVIDCILTGKLSPNLSVAAVGGIDAAAEGIRAVMEGRFAGKVVIFPQLRDLPLTPLKSLAKVQPKFSDSLGPEHIWTKQSEQLLIEAFSRR